MNNSQFPEYVSDITGCEYGLGLYLTDVSGDIATYQRSEWTGAWSLRAQYVNNELICVDCLGSHLIGRKLFPITEEEFVAQNGGYYSVKTLKSSTFIPEKDYYD